MRTLNRPSTEGAHRVVYLFGEAQGDIAALNEAGFTVVSDRAPSLRSVREALYGQDPELEGHVTSGIAWVGPSAADGSLRLAAGEWLAPTAIEPRFVTHELGWAAFGGCSSGQHAARWTERLGAGVRVLGLREEDLPVLALARDARSVPIPATDWETEAPEVGELAADPEQDAYWAELFGLLEPQRARLVEEQLGLTTRQLAWRLGELFATAAVHQLQGKREQAAADHASAAGAALVISGEVPPLFPGAGDVQATLDWLGEVLPHSAVGRGLERFGPDHSALFASSLQLLLLSLSAEASDPLRERLRELGPATGVPADLWDMVLGYSSQELFASGHQVVFDALSAERAPRHASRALAFGLGRRLALASGMNLDDDPDAQDMIDGCKDMANLLEVELPPFDRRGKYSALAKQLGSKLGPDHQSLFQLATGLIALRAAYDPMSPETIYRHMKRISRARKKAGLPGKLFKPLRRVKESTANRSKGYDLIDRTLQDISEHLMTEID